jgi:hypothetical protein
MRLLIAALLLSSIAAAQTSSDHHHEMVIQHGEQEMGFSQSATTHHFLASEKGGAIQVEANDPKDMKSRDEIRMHLQHVAKAFAGGDFDLPMFVHDTKSIPGVADLQRLKADIRYTYFETKGGGKVAIESKNPEAIAAVHKFLRFQIEEHRTGDPLPKE